MIRDIKAGKAQFKHGIPLVCVPLSSTDKESLIKEAAGALAADIVEWRIDFYNEDLRSGLSELRTVLGDIPVLITLRTKPEGGNIEVSSEEYRETLSMVINELQPELVDIEFSSPYCKDLVSLAAEKKVVSVVSSHDFHSTAPEEELVNKLNAMEKIGADIPKVAQMPQSFEDVLTLLSATSKVSQTNFPIITMSMGKFGKVSRLCGEVSGSALTFGAGVSASAPGQIRAKLLKEILTELSY